jgi:hypothetical protein
MTTVRIDASEVHDLADDMRRNTDLFPERAQLAVAKTGYDIEATAKVLVKVDTGFLRNSISTDVGELSVEVGPTADYGDIIERGVPHPFTITAKAGGTLHFVIDGHDVFAKSVVHPPIAPSPYMSPAFDKGLSELEDALGDLGEQVLDRA